MNLSDEIDYGRCSLQELLNCEKSIDKEKYPDRHRQILEMIAVKNREAQAFGSDQSHLENLSIAHYIVGAIMALFSCMPLIHMFMGLAFIVGGDSMFSGTEAPPPDLFGWIFFLVGLFFFLGGQAVSISVIVSGNFLKKKKNYVFSFVIACISCMFMPFGTVLGVLTIIVLSRDTVKSLYAQAKLNKAEK